MDISLLSTLLILMFKLPSQVLGDSNWVNIVMKSQPECSCDLALDIAAPYCVGSPVVLKPHDPYKPSQQWQWQGNMLVNRLTGMAITTQSDKRLLLGKPTDAENQQFSATDPDQTTQHQRIMYKPLISSIQHFIDTSKQLGHFENMPTAVFPQNKYTSTQLFSIKPAADTARPAEVGPPREVFPKVFPAMDAVMADAPVVGPGYQPVPAFIPAPSPGVVPPLVPASLPGLPGVPGVVPSAVPGVLPSQYGPKCPYPGSRYPYFGSQHSCSGARYPFPSHPGAHPFQPHPGQYPGHYCPYPIGPPWGKSPGLARVIYPRVDHEYPTYWVPNFMASHRDYDTVLPPEPGQRAQSDNKL